MKSLLFTVKIVVKKIMKLNIFIPCRQNFVFEGMFLTVSKKPSYRYGQYTGMKGIEYSFRVEDKDRDILETKLKAHYLSALMSLKILK